MGAVAVSAAPVRDALPWRSFPAEVPSAPISRAPERTDASCGPGPERLSQMTERPGGYRTADVLDEPRRHQFYFARAMYSDNGMRPGFGFFRGRSGDYLGDAGPPWSIDYPRADRHMMMVATRLSNLDACLWGRPVSLADPALTRFPFLYSLEWGYIDLSEAEVEGLRGYLEAGGLLMIDDTWGTEELANLEHQLGRVLPGRPVMEIPRDHLLFHSHYAIEDEIPQVPNYRNGMEVGMGYPGARTFERDGYTPYIRGVFDDRGRLMVVIYANTDLGDALEWAEDPRYPLRFSTAASQLFLNTIIYAMTE